MSERSTSERSTSERSTPHRLAALLACLLLAPAASARAETLDFCHRAEPAPEVLERVVHFDLAKNVFSPYVRDPARIAHGAVVRVRYPLEVEGGEPSAVRYTGSGAPELCRPAVEEAPDCDGAATPFYDVWIVNREQLSAECLRKVDLHRLLCVRELDERSTALEVDNRQPCEQPLRLGLLMTVKSTRPVTVGGRDYLRQFQTPDPTLILEPPEPRPRDGGGG